MLIKYKKIIVLLTKLRKIYNYAVVIFIKNHKNQIKRYHYSDLKGNYFPLIKQSKII